MKKHLLPILFVSTLLVSACAADPEQTALENYLSEGEEIGSEMSDMGTQFETLMNVQGNMLAWTDAEKAELTAVQDKLADLVARADLMIPPAILTDIHPLLLRGLDEMTKAVDGVAEIAENPAKATEANANKLERHATAGEKLATEFVEKLEKAVDEEYPD